MEQTDTNLVASNKLNVLYLYYLIYLEKLLNLSEYLND